MALPLLRFCHWAIFGKVRIGFCIWVASKVIPPDLMFLDQVRGAGQCECRAPPGWIGATKGLKPSIVAAKGLA